MNVEGSPLKIVLYHLHGVPNGAFRGRTAHAANRSDHWSAGGPAGVRGGNARSGHGTVLHVDLALPISAPSAISSVQFLLEARGSF